MAWKLLARDLANPKVEFEEIKQKLHQMHLTPILHTFDSKVTPIELKLGQIS